MKMKRIILICMCLALAFPTAMQAKQKKSKNNDALIAQAVELAKRCETARWSQTHKSTLSSDCGLQPAHMKLELLVIADQHAAVNTFPGLVHTARHTMGVCNTRSQ